VFQPRCAGSLFVQASHLLASRSYEADPSTRPGSPLTSHTQLAKGQPNHLEDPGEIWSCLLPLGGPTSRSLQSQPLSIEAAQTPHPHKHRSRLAPHPAHAQLVEHSKHVHHPRASGNILRHFCCTITRALGRSVVIEAFWLRRPGRSAVRNIRSYEGRRDRFRWSAGSEWRGMASCGTNLRCLAYRRCRALRFCMFRY